jgi:hypothetical protein
VVNDPPLWASWRSIENAEANEKDSNSQTTPHQLTKQVAQLQTWKNPAEAHGRGKKGGRDEIQKETSCD